MIQSLLIGIGGVIVLMLFWVVVQTFWGKAFSEYMSDEDAMAGRTKCSNCGCTTACENKNRPVGVGSSD
jgi:hypothetical protein